MINVNFINTPIGWLELRDDGEFLLSLDFCKLEGEQIGTRTKVFAQSVYELEEYFAGKRRSFSIPILPKGTDFQKKVWKALLNIAYGQTKSYKDIAQEIGNPLACRAVGNASNKNPLPIIIPCHRVIGVGKQLVGYAGGLTIKKFLLDLEQK